jgi:general secretion pathway protein H
MMRTSATGRADAVLHPIARGAEGDRARQGFTLVELLMTVAILGLAAGAVVLSMPDPRPGVGDEAERFAARLIAARDEAVLANRPVAVEVTAKGYALSAFDGATWSPLAEGPLRGEAWLEGSIMKTDPDPARIVFDPTGAADAATVTLARDGRALTIVVDGAGQVTVNG